MLAWVLLVVAVVANISSNFLFKTAMASFPAEINFSTLLRFAFNPYLWMGAACCGILLASYLLALRDIELTVSYAFVISLSLVGIMVLSPIVLHEPLRLQTVIGAALVIGGILTIASASRVAPQLADSHQASEASKS